MAEAESAIGGAHGTTIYWETGVLNATGTSDPAGCTNAKQSLPRPVDCGSTTHITKPAVTAASIVTTFRQYPERTAAR